MGIYKVLSSDNNEEKKVSVSIQKLCKFALTIGLTVILALENKDCDQEYRQCKTSLMCKTTRI